MRVTCVFTVVSERNSSAAISELDRPRPISCSTSTSRPVSSGGGETCPGSGRLTYSSRSRGAWPAAIGAFLAVIGAAGSLGDFGAALPTLARQSDRGAAVSFVNHLGPVYGVNGALGACTLIGLLLTFVALWRARLIHVAYLGVFLLGAALLSFAGGRPIGLLGSFAVLTVAMLQITRLLLRPAGIPGVIVLPEHDHAAV